MNIKESTILKHTIKGRSIFIKEGDPFRIITFKYKNAENHVIFPIVGNDSDDAIKFINKHKYEKDIQKIIDGISIYEFLVNGNNILVVPNGNIRLFNYKKDNYNFDFSTKDFEISLKVYNSFKEVEDFLNDDFVKDFEIYKFYDSDDFSKENFLKMSKKKLTEEPIKKLMLEYCKEDINFRINMYKKNCIFNNQLFYKDPFASGTGDVIKFSKEQLKNILDAPAFNSKSKILGGSQRQCQNAVNHLLKTQDLTLELIQLILDKYKDDAETSFSIIKFMTSSKKVVIPEGTEKLLPDAINKTAEMIVMNQDLHYLVKSFKKKIDITKIEDDCVKLLLECIE